MLSALTKGVSQLGLQLNAAQLAQLVELNTQLLKWNKAYNLTSTKNADDALKLHLLDSLALVPFWQFENTLDVGTGAGFPGLPLAIALPQQQFHLLDSNSKKIRFIRQQIHELGLSNVVAHHSRVEEHVAAVTDGYSAIVSRAFASLPDMLQLTEHLLMKGGRWMAMKSVLSEQEQELLTSQVVIENVHTLEIPGLDAKRCLIELVRRND